ncbi:hypothetical protein CN085_10720 [Sinorhizobium meliloti]|nr:hypothetical protein CN085_10720 [Sinorhizobium meliloti]
MSFEQRGRFALGLIVLAIGITTIAFVRQLLVAQRGSGLTRLLVTHVLSTQPSKANLKLYCVRKTIKEIKLAQRGGNRPGAGRRPGAVSKAKRDLASMAPDRAEMLWLFWSRSREWDSAAARVSAANAILDRGYGKPVQATEVSGPNGGPAEVSTLADHYSNAFNRG